MTDTELKKTLRDNGIGGLFGRGLRVFDKEYHLPKFSDANNRVIRAVNQLAAKGLPISAYRKDGVDCDNFAMWIQSLVTIDWAIERLAFPDTPAYPLGTAIIPGHAINIAVCKDGIKTWNYGAVHGFDLKTIKEVEFK